METLLKIDSLSFKYPKSEKQALRSVSLEIKRGDFVLLTGRSGASKTTLLRHIKSELAPFGEKSGEIYLGGKKLSELSAREKASKIAFVMQSSVDALVCDTVGGEIAFAMESLALEDSLIRKKTAQICRFLGIGDMLGRKTAELSGGERQLVCIAAALVLSPELLLLDEPLAQLDPIAAQSLCRLLVRLNTELGITVVVGEHRLDTLLPFADKVVLLSQGGVRFCGSAREFAEKSREELADFLPFMPEPVQIYALAGFSGECPLTVRDGIRLLSENICGGRRKSIPSGDEEFSQTVVKLREVSFRYSRNGKNTLDCLSAEFKKGAFTAVLGGNGEGKTTLLKLILGSLKPFEGKVKRSFERCAYLPQEPVFLFSEKTVEEELRLVSPDFAETARLVGIEDIMSMNAADLSGGEMQKAALAKLLLTKPEVLLLDEMTKGLDGEYKLRLGEILKALTKSGVSVIAVSHDAAFCAEFADICMLLFDGRIACCDSTRRFFTDDTLFTTPSHIMSRSVFENAITAREVALLCRESEESL